MNWNRWTIGRKISAGFGIVIVLLVGLGALSFNGVGGIVNNAEEVIEGKALDGELAQKEVDHLNWIGQVNRLLTDKNVTELNVETDHTRCGFGRWLYGPEREEAEALVPTLGPLFTEIEAPHRLLHESAVEIGRVYAAADPSLPGFICKKLNEHLEWAATIQKGILNNSPAIEIQTDHRLCAFGKWLYSDAAKATAESDPEIGRMLEQIKKPHEELHASAKQVIASYQQVHTGLRNTLRRRLDDHRKWAAKVSAGLVANEAADVETDPQKCEFGKWLISEETTALMASDEALSNLLSQVAAPHDALHRSAIDINRAIGDEELNQAKSIFADQTQKRLKQVSTLFGQAIAHEDQRVAGRETAVQTFRETSLPRLTETRDLLVSIQHLAQQRLDGQHQASQVYATRTAPNLAKVQDLLNRLRSEVKANMLTDEAMLAAANSTRRNVAVTAGVAILAGLFFAFLLPGALSRCSRASPRAWGKERPR